MENSLLFTPKMPETFLSAPNFDPNPVIKECLFKGKWLVHNLYILADLI